MVYHVFNSYLHCSVYFASTFRIWERIWNDDELTDKSVQKNSLVVVCESSGKFVVRRQLQVQEESLYGWVHLSCEVAGDNVEGDELVRHRDNVSVVGGETHGEDGELMPFHRVLERAARGVHAVEGRDQGILVDAHLVALPQQAPHVSAILPLRQQPTVQLAGEHLRVVLEDRSSQADRVCYQVDLLLVLWVFDQVDRVLKIAKDLVQRKGGHLGIKPPVVEEHVVIEVFVPVAPDKLERELAELPQVVP